MAIKYVGEPPHESGYYLVRVDGKLDVAEYHDGNWDQLGIDYDVWQYSRDVYEIEIIKKLDLGELAR